MFARIKTIAACAAVGAVVAVAVPHIAGATNSSHYTGCLATNGGLTKFANGDNPVSACGSSQQKITLGDGTAMNGFSKNSPVINGVSAVSGTNCPDGSVFSSVGQAKQSTAKFTLATGMYNPKPAGAFRWSFWKNHDQFGSSKVSGSIKAEIVQVRNGQEKVVSTFARRGSQNFELDDSYEMDFVSFNSLATDQYYVRASATASDCMVTNFLGIQVEFDRVG